MTEEKKTDIFIMPQQRKLVVRIILSAALTTLGIVLVLPLTQYLSGDPRDQYRIRSVDVSLPPPPPPPPEAPPPPEEEEPEPEVEDIQQPPQQLSLSQLEAALNPGSGGGIAGDFSLDSFSISAESVTQALFFSIDDLDSRPKRLKAIAPDVPFEVRNQGLKGIIRIEIMIDEQGHVSVGNVVEATHQEMVQPTKQAFSKWLFEPPMKDGQPVKAKYIQPFQYDFSK
ncbi:MAG: energy transducer TonB [Opitutales bacterium]|nr:energy transducer TonB [Opitutales bacterium]